MAIGKFFRNLPMSNKKIIIILSLLVGVSLFLHFFKVNLSPPCISVDEAAYGYNAFSILKTGKDEFARLLPLRLRSFGDFKLPLYSYLTIPFIAILGLTETAIRLPSFLSAAALVVVGFFLSLELFKNKRLALITSLFIALSPWIGSISRHAHEVIPATLFLATSLLFLLRFKNHRSLPSGILSIIFISLALYTYHISRVFYVFLLGYYLYLCFKQKISIRKWIITIAVISIFLIPFAYAELTLPPTRLASLLITNNEGINLKHSEWVTEFARSPFNTKLFITANEVTNRYIQYFSPEFLVLKGDENPRFGMEGLQPITIVEYLLCIIGIFLMLKKHRKEGLLLLFVLIISPLPAALTWQEYALTRAFFMIIPIIIFASYAAEEILKSNIQYKKLLVIGFALIYLLFVARSWEFYLFHYPHRATAVRSWFCGYKELGAFVKENYSKYDKFYITQEVGQPYMGLLFYLQYDPAKYQKNVRTTPPDEYGFTTVTGFDKFVFNTSNFSNDPDYNGVYVFSQAEGQALKIHESDVQKVTVGSEQMFWIYIPRKNSNQSNMPK